jgi:hypothetical protein
VAAAKERLLQADAGVFDARDNPVRANADKGNDSGPQAFDFGLQTLAAGAQFVGRKFIGARGGAFDDVRDAEFEFEQQWLFEWRVESRGEAATMQGRPKAISGTAEVMADGGCVEPWIYPSKQHDQVLSDEIRNELVVRGEKLSFRRLPGSGQFSILHAAPWLVDCSIPNRICDTRALGCEGLATIRRAPQSGFRRPALRVTGVTTGFLRKNLGDDVDFGLAQSTIG